VDWAHTFTLAEAGFLVFIGVAGVAFGLGTLLLNRQHVVSTMEQRFKVTAEEMRAGFRRDLEMQMMRLESRHAAEISEVKQQAVLALAESQMNASTALTWQRRVEDLEKQLRSGITINAGNDATIGGDIAGRDYVSHRSP